MLVASVQAASAAKVAIEIAIFIFGRDESEKVVFLILWLCQESRLLRRDPIPFLVGLNLDPVRHFLFNNMKFEHSWEARRSS